MKPGEIQFQLDEDLLVLKTTPHALRTVLTKHGGMRNAIQKVYMMEADIMEDIIEAGLAPTPVKREALQENVFKAGIINLIEPLTNYLMLLANGGKQIEEKKGDDVKGES